MATLATRLPALAFYSAQNIDRLVTVYRAAVRSHRKLVIDLYGASIAAATGNRTIPQSSWRGVRVCLRTAERIRIKQSRQFERIRALGASRIYPEEIAADPSQYVVTSRLSSLVDLEHAGCLANARAFWSMWDGYLARDQRLRPRLDRLDIPIELAHVSGHAHPSELVDFANRLGAASIVPVHSEAPELLEEKLGSVTPQRDGEWRRPESLSERLSEQDERNGRRK
jgi:ribonuclease J